MNPETTSSPEQSPTEIPAENYNQPEPAFGWTLYAEQINGRFAMIGFVALLVLEFFTHQDFFTWLGLR
ncbi:chlorophyll a/b-binding protein [Coleofasciculus sp. FACHB-1120]|uniref:chlorophyll a/b-binding protein n=1 Tax=Coleofasciculus sp. FACHB-1120 TaxID=2692783 RepID=UPI0016835E90|nr:chlorophyll a/b-binding protein [Coleofasciculus sp. FACHB-1120]MBD2743341.1 high light inducible protein [Coleofasciculus sp. FACHB-1120]